MNTQLRLRLSLWEQGQADEIESVWPRVPLRVRERESEAEERGVLWERRRRYFTGKRALVGERERERERETEGERLGTVPPVGADGGEFNVILVLSASHLYIVVDSEAERERERRGWWEREQWGGRVHGPRSTSPRDHW